MPDPNNHSKVKGISLSGVSNPWLDSLERRYPTERLIHRDPVLEEQLRGFRNRPEFPELALHFPDAPQTFAP